MTYLRHGIVQLAADHHSFQVLYELLFGVYLVLRDQDIEALSQLYSILFYFIDSFTLFNEVWNLVQIFIFDHLC